MMTSVRPRRDDRAVDGILLLDKPAGLSSNAALQRVRRALQARKAGHGGSLDPLATGMLPLCFGQATKACGTLLGASKTYRASIRLGVATSTGDTEGEITATAAVPTLVPARIDATLTGFLGRRLQVPPMHSALKVAGRRLYALARRGESVERRPRPIVIHALRRAALDDDRLVIEVRCSKGTYVRTLGEEIAVALGTVGHLDALRRLEVEPFTEGMMVALADVESRAAHDPQSLTTLLLPPDASLSGLPALAFDPEQTEALLHGRVVMADGHGPGIARAYDASGRFLGVIDLDEDSIARVRRLFVAGAG